MSASDYLEAALVNLILRGTSFSAPTSVWISAHDGDPGETGANEISGNAYARVEISTSGGFASPVNGVTANLDDIVFPTATGSWGTITHVCVWDASTSGNCLFVVTLDLSDSIETNETLRISSGDLTITVS